MASDNPDGAKIGKFNVADGMELAMKYGISAVPTILLFKGGEVVERMRGFKEKEELQKVIDAHVTV